jgi:hypothetical protein
MINKLRAYWLYKKIVEENGGWTMKNWKTTVSGVIAALGQLLPLVGVALTPEVTQAITVIGLFLMGLFSKDSNVTGVGKDAQTIPIGK